MVLSSIVSGFEVKKHAEGALGASGSTSTLGTGRMWLAHPVRKRRKFALQGPMIGGTRRPTGMVQLGGTPFKEGLERPRRWGEE